MRNLVVSFTLAVSFSFALAAQQPANPTDAASTPKPDEHGIYDQARGVLEPLFLDRKPIELSPSDTAPASYKPSIVRVVIAADGSLQSAEVVQSANADFDNALLDAIKHSRFSPGSVGGNPVPVRLYLITRVLPDGRVFPRILSHPPSEFQHAQTRNYDVPPRPMHTVEAEFSEEARKNKIEGAVIVSALIGVDGIPSDLQLTRRAGHGLDENALAAVAQYRFQPATKNGVPVATRIYVEINFRLGHSY